MKKSIEYYPFGLQTNNSWTRENSSNNFLYNAGNELNQNSGWYETFFRGYDPAIGRFLQVDPMSFSEQATYQYAANNPVYYNDPKGAMSQDPCNWCRGGKFYEGTWGGSSPTPIEGGGGFHGNWRPGSGNHWTDGIQYSDWTLSGGSQMYRDGLSAGLTDIGGRLFAIGDKGTLIEAQEKNGRLGFSMDVYDDWYVNGEYVDSYYLYSYFKPLDQQGGPNWPFKDKQGEILFNHWMLGKGKALYLADKDWGDYMKANKNLRHQLGFHLRKLQGNGLVMGSIHAVLSDSGTGGFQTGYDLLNGSNALVGDFQYWGTAIFNDDNTVTYNLTLVWNDIIDPNRQYLDDTILSGFFKTVSEPQDYNVHIQWTDTITFDRDGDY